MHYCTKVAQKHFGQVLMVYLATEHEFVVLISVCFLFPDGGMMQGGLRTQVIEPRALCCDVLHCQTVFEMQECHK